MANKSTFTCHVWTPQKVVEPGAAAEFGLSEKPTGQRASGGGTPTTFPKILISFVAPCSAHEST
jgi:hypothetical protein